MGIPSQRIMQATITLGTCHATRALQIDQKHLVSTLPLLSRFGHKSIMMQEKALPNLPATTLTNKTVLKRTSQLQTIGMCLGQTRRPFCRPKSPQYPNFLAGSTALALYVQGPVHFHQLCPNSPSRTSSHLLAINPKLLRMHKAMDAAASPTKGPSI